MADKQLSHEDIRDLIRAALNAGVAANTSRYVRAVYPDDVVFAEYLDGSGAETLWKADWAIDSDSVKIGTPVQVVERRSFEPVKIAKFSIDAFPASGSWRGKIFEAGEYPDKDVAFTEQDIAEMASSFAGPMKANIEHAPSILDGELGELVAVEAVGHELYGTFSAPGWLRAALNGRAVPVSVEIDKASKRLTGIGLVTSPRVADAQLVAAFSGAGKPRKGGSMKIKELLKAVFSRAIEEIEDAEGDIKFDGSPGKGANDEELQRLRDENKRMQEARINGSAVAFADSAIASGKAVPAEKESLIALFTQAALDDNQGKSCFNEAGALVEGTRVKALRDMVAARPTIATAPSGEAIVVMADGGGARKNVEIDAGAIYESRRKAMGVK